MGKKRGPKPKLDAKTQARIVRALKKGCFRIEAAHAAGITKGTFCDWMKKGLAEPKTGLHRKFRTAVLEAEASTLEGLLDRVKVKSPALLLSRRFKKRWGDPARKVEIGGLGEDAKPIVVRTDLSGLSAAKLAKLEAVLAEPEEATTDEAKTDVTASAEGDQGPADP